MARYQIQGLEQLGPALAELLPRAIAMLYVCLREEIGEQAILTLVDLSPVGTGKYRASHTPSVGQVVSRVLPNMPAYPIPGIPEVDAALQGSSPGESFFIANAVADDRHPESSYAGLLEGGRRPYSRVRSRRSSWFGSTQAPDGIYGPTVKALQALRATITANAIERAKARI